VSTASRLFGALIYALALAACAMLFLMMLVICADVALRNIAIPGLPRGIAWSNEVSEMLLYGLTMAAAPWLLRQGQHIRVDILLRAIPNKLAYSFEWLADTLGLICSIVIAWYGLVATMKSYAAGSQSIKTLVLPEWWLLAPLPICFALLAIEFVFRMQRLALSEAKPRDDAVSAA
jgi:TRAP-type transport system small permease protein